MDVREDGGDILLDVLRRWAVMKQRKPLSLLEKASTSEPVVRFSQGELAAFRALESVLRNPSEKLKKLLTEQERDEMQ